MLKTCKRCGVEKPITDFHENPRMKFGRLNQCAACVVKAHKERREANLEKHNAANAEWRRKNGGKYREGNARWRANNPDRVRDNNLKRLGFTAALFDALLAAQDFKCGICGVDLRKLKKKLVHADHCHTTGAARGILCHYCNIGMGHFNDDPALLRAAVEYLERKTK